jgi:Flp pilus assembly protein CpaB
VVLNYFYVENVRKGENEKSFNVFIATRSLKPGDRLKERDAEAIQLPRRFEQSFVRMGAMTDSDMASVYDKEQVKRSVPSGTILIHNHFVEPTDARELDLNITNGMREVSLPVNSRTISGVLRAGMWVDIEAPFQVGGSLPLVMPVLERVQLKAVGSQSAADADQGGRSRSPSSYHTITIEVTPKDATSLAMIERLAVGDFEIQIRPPGDTKLVKIPPPSADSGINPAVMDLLRRRLGEPPAPKR